MISKYDFILVGVVSFIIAIIGFILDLNERVPDIATNIFEVLMMTGLLYLIISLFYFPLKLLIKRYCFRK